MVHTIGLIGANGRIGSEIAKNLVSKATNGNIKVVLLYRQQSPLKGFEASSNVDLRAIDLDGPASDLESAVKGISVFISALSPGASDPEIQIVDALSKSSSKDLITYIPSVYSAPWDPTDHASPALGPILSFLHSAWDRALQSGFNVTPVYAGGFDEYMFAYGFIVPPIKSNTFQANSSQLKHRFPITLAEHLGFVVANVAVAATENPNTIKAAKGFQAVTYWPTGQELVDLWTKLNDGKPTEVKDFSAEDLAALREDAANLGPIKAGYWEHWEKDDFAYGEFESVEGFVAPGLEEVARRYV